MSPISLLSGLHRTGVTLLRMHPWTRDELMKAKDARGMYLFQPAMYRNSPDTLMGFPVVLSLDDAIGCIYALDAELRIVRKLRI